MNNSYTVYFNKYAKYVRELAFYLDKKRGHFPIGLAEDKSSIFVATKSAVQKAAKRLVSPLETNSGISFTQIETRFPAGEAFSSVQHGIKPTLEGTGKIFQILPNKVARKVIADLTRVQDMNFSGILTEYDIYEVDPDLDTQLGSFIIIKHTLSQSETGLQNTETYSSVNNEGEENVLFYRDRSLPSVTRKLALD